MFGIGKLWSLLFNNPEQCIGCGDRSHKHEDDVRYDNTAKEAVKLTAATLDARPLEFSITTSSNASDTVSSPMQSNSSQIQRDDASSYHTATVNFVSTASMHHPESTYSSATSLQQPILQQQQQNTTSQSRPSLKHSYSLPTQPSSTITAFSIAPNQREGDSRKIENSAPPSNTKRILNKVYDTAASTLSFYVKPSATTDEDEQQSIDRDGLVKAMQLVDLAADEFEGGNEATGLDIYLAAFDKLIMAIPKLREEETKQILADKFTQLGHQFEFITSDKENVNSITDADKLSPDNPVRDKEKRRGSTAEVILYEYKALGQCLTDLLTKCVVKFKQSPIPGLLRTLFSFVIQLLIRVDQRFDLVGKAQYVTASCIKVLFEWDEKYKLHEFVTEATFTMLRSSLIAVAAYLEAPSYSETKQSRRGKVCN